CELVDQLLACGEKLGIPALGEVLAQHPEGMVRCAGGAVCDGEAAGGAVFEVAETEGVGALPRERGDDVVVGAGSLGHQDLRRRPRPSGRGGIRTPSGVTRRSRDSPKREALMISFFRLPIRQRNGKIRTCVRRTTCGSTPPSSKLRC